MFLSNALIYGTGGIFYRAVHVDTELGENFFLTIKLYFVREVQNMVLEALLHVKCRRNLIVGTLTQTNVYRQ
jgi:hypothetical protein